MQIVLLTGILGTMIGIGFALSKIYAELEYSNRLRIAELQNAGIEVPEAN